jgi:hypothetical protein
VQHEIVVPRAGDLERVELEEAQALDDRHHRLGVRRE